MISLRDVQTIQKKWGDNLVELGKLKGDFDACKKNQNG